MDEREGERKAKARKGKAKVRKKTRSEEGSQDHIKREEMKRRTNQKRKQREDDGMEWIKILSISLCRSFGVNCFCSPQFDSNSAVQKTLALFSSNPNNPIQPRHTRDRDTHKAYYIYYVYSLSISLLPPSPLLSLSFLLFHCRSLVSASGWNEFLSSLDIEWSSIHFSRGTKL